MIWGKVIIFLRGLRGSDSRVAQIILNVYLKSSQEIIINLG